MFKRRSVSELIFYIITLVVCLVSVLFLCKLLSCDDSRYSPKSEVMYFEGEIVDYREVKGDLRFQVASMPNVEFKTDLWSLISKESFENCIKNNDIFKIGYSTNTLHKDQYEVITLSSEDEIMVSRESRSKAVTTNIIIYVVGLILLSFGFVYLLIGLVRWFRRI